MKNKVAGGGGGVFNYLALEDEKAKVAQEALVREKGFFILPSQCFIRVLDKAKDSQEYRDNLNTTLSDILPLFKPPLLALLAR